MKGCGGRQALPRTLEVSMQRDHLKILLEEMNSKFTLVLEGHSALHQEIMNSRQDTAEKFAMVDFKFEVLNNKIDTVEVRLNAKIDTVNAKIDAVNAKIDTVEARLNAKIDNVEERLNTRIDAVEHNLGRKIDAVADDLAEHRSDTEAHHGLYRVKEK